MPPRLTATLESIGAAPDLGAYEELLALLGGTLAPLAGVLRQTSGVVDVSEMTLPETCALLRAELGDVEGQVLAAWPGDGVAVRLAPERLLEHFDDLWYPAMDDLVLVGATGEGRKLVVLDHEERLASTPLSAVVDQP
ncbi:hypothetical protein [Streptomyces sp. NBC_01361]|uniref:hypothetical protein n=1 Tax=Streptomyces sp. NBC_01361 TaxID=2903838 RepID=UPI002E33C6E3|nr:hypothetical protein [Streptomyces sp. NBC_01361]